MPIETIWRAVAARRPLTQPTTPIALGDLDQQRARGLGHVRVGGVPDDRRQRAVDVEQHRCAGGFGAERLERLHERGSGGHEHKYGALPKK